MYACMYVCVCVCVFVSVSLSLSVYAQAHMYARAHKHREFQAREATLLRAHLCPAGLLQAWQHRETERRASARAHTHTHVHTHEIPFFCLTILKQMLNTLPHLIRHIPKIAP